MTKHPLNRATSILLGLIYKHLGKPFLRFQKWLFGAFIVTTFVGIPYAILVEKKVPQELFQLALMALMWWFILAAGTSIVWLLCIKLVDLDLWIFYYFWIPIIIPMFGKMIYKNNIRYLDSLILILESYEYEKKGQRPCPVFIKRAHLERKSFWPHWEFSIITILKPGKFAINVTKSRTDNRFKRWIMDVDLVDESFGIYNNAGKRFLREKFRIPSALETMNKLSQIFFDVLNTETESGSSVRWGEAGEILPLRWVSGGFLPIIEFKNRHWVMLFFRDISPIGLNIAIGASENKSEYKDLHKLIGREFSEETVLLVSEPRPGGYVPQQRFTVEQFGIDNSQPISEYVNPEFVEKHNLLRKLHDGIDIEILNNEDGRPITPIRTPFRVNLKYHSPDLRSVDKKYIKNVLFSINPFEFGVEIVWLCKFQLQEGEYILDGEYDLGRDYLVRQPVVLLSMDFLKQVYMKDHTLGQKIDGSDSKLLPEIPKEHIIIYNQDIELRKRRLKNLETIIKSSTFIRSEKDNLVYEKKRIEKWLSDYQEPFTLHEMKAKISFEALRTLCPVTWKSLELIFLHKINYWS